MMTLTAKHLSLILCVLCLSACLAGSAAAQSQQPDSLPQGPGWHVVYRDTTRPFYSVSFPTPDSGWVVGGRYSLLQTTDSGQTWKYVNAPGPFSRVLFTTGQTGYLNSSTSVSKTTNGGASWTTHPTGISGGFPNSMAFPCLDTGFLAGDGYVSRTTDAGETWNATIMLTQTDAVSFCDPLHGFTGGGVAFYTPDPHKPVHYVAALFGTSDGGATWEPIYSGLTFGIGTIYTLNPTTIIASLSNGVLARSTDGGTTWDTSNSVTSVGYSVTAISFADSLRGLAVAGAGVIAFTSDGGKHWIKQSSGTTTDLEDVQLLSNGSAFVVGDAGIVLSNHNVADMVVANSSPVDLPVQLFPNPANSALQFQYTLPEAEHVTLTIYDVSGQLVESVLNGVSQSPGNQSVTISTAHLAAGTYYARLSLGTGEVRTIRFVKE